MKKSFLIAMVFCLACTIAQSQIQKGNVLVGGDLGGFNLGLNSSGYFNLNITPKAAWFIKDNLAVGGYVNLDLATAKGQGTTTNYGVGALGRYYVNDPKINVLRHARFFAEANVGIEGNNYSGGNSTNGLGIGFGPGLAYFITPNIGLEGLLKYDGIVGFGSNPTSSSLDFNIGFQIYLPSRQFRDAAKGKVSQ